GGSRVVHAQRCSGIAGRSLGPPPHLNSGSWPQVLFCSSPDKQSCGSSLPAKQRCNDRAKGETVNGRLPQGSQSVALVVPGRKASATVIVVAFCNAYKPLLQSLIKMRTAGHAWGHQYYSDVHDVGFRQTRLEEVAGRLKEGVGVVALQERLRIQSQDGGAMERGGIGKGGSGVGGAVLAVGAGAEEDFVPH